MGSMLLLVHFRVDGIGSTRTIYIIKGGNGGSMAADVADGGYGYFESVES